MALHPVLVRRVLVPVLGALLLGGGLLLWRERALQQQVEALGCPAQCCGHPPTCTSYYYTPAFRADTEDVYRRTLEALAPQPGQQFADVGAGWGAISLKLAAQVGPTGLVWATDLAKDRLAEIDLRATERGLSNVRTRVVTDPYAIGLPDAVTRLDGLVFLNSVNFKHDQARDQVVAYLQQWRKRLAPGARVIYHTDWVDRWLLDVQDVQAIFAEAGYGAAEKLPLPRGLTGQTCYCPADGGPVAVSAGYLLRWQVPSGSQ